MVTACCRKLFPEGSRSPAGAPLAKPHFINIPESFVMADNRLTPCSNSLSGLQAGINRTFPDVLNFEGDFGRTGGFCSWRPPADLDETGGRCALSAEMPGARRENISIEIRANNVLTLSGERRAFETCRNEHYHRSKQISGGFERPFTMASAVDPGAVRAIFIEGALQVCIPRGGTTDTRRVEID
jgi:HSP20 family protein